MKQLIKLAWYNIWRKKRRSIIALLSVTFAVVLAISFRSLQWGSYDKMIAAGVRNTGYLQVHATGYWKDKSVNDLIEANAEFQQQIQDIPGIRAAIPRLQNFALAAADATSKGTMVIGIVPEQEDTFNRLSDRLVKGAYLTAASKEVIIAEGLANYLHLNTGDTLVLVGQGYHGSTAAGKYRITGVLKLLNPQMNQMTVYMPLQLAQEYNNAPQMISAYMLDVQQSTEVTQLSAVLRKSLGQKYDVLTWKEMLPEIQQSINTDTAIATLLLTALYTIVGFGIIGTIVMMALERKREFGMLQAIGMKKGQIQALVLIESLVLGLLGVLLAYLIAFPFVSFMHHNPIPLTGEGAKSFEAMGVEPVIQFAIKPHLFLLMGGVVFCIMLLASVFPLTLIKRIKLSEVIK